MINEWEKTIRFREIEIHTNLVVRHKDGTTSPKPDIIGYLDEDTMLADYMVWLHNTHEWSRNCIFHIENEGNSGGLQGKIQGARSTAKGKKKGVLDVESVYLGLTIFLEFKLISGTFSNEQIDIIKTWSSWGIDIYIIRNFDFFKYVIEEVIYKRVSKFGMVIGEKGAVRLAA